MNPVAYSAELVSTAGAGYVSTQLGPLQWSVRALELREMLDEPFVLELTMIAKDVALDVNGLVGGKLSLSMERRDAGEDGGDLERVVRGVVTSAEYLGTFDERLHLKLVVRPSLALAGLVLRSRIFQGLSVPEVIAATAKEHLDEDDAVDLTRLRLHLPRDYCVQFRESDLAFIQRIAAEEGIHFLLEQEAPPGLQTLILVDDSDRFRPVVLSADDPEPATPPSVPVITDRAETADTGAVTMLTWRRDASPLAHHARAFDWLATQPTPLDTALKSDGAPWESGEQFVHDFRRTPEDGNAHRDETERLAELLRQRSQTRSMQGLGHSNVLGFCAGGTFALEGHPSERLDDTYVLTRVTHQADCPEADVRAGGGLGGANYTNRFHCLPVSAPSRPRLRGKPRIFGHQTATVIGPPGEEIHTDAHGRIQVWMHWDREGPSEAMDRACWLRVAQSMAGPGFGTVFIPRVGMDVLIAFVDGDPDRPICVGCLYDGRNTPPYALPEEKTKSTIKTRSSPGGNGYNELRFEDAAGSEQVFLHAQRNLDEQVGAAHTTTVGSSQSVSVGADQTVKIGGSREVTINGNQHITVLGAPKDGAPVGHTMGVLGGINFVASKTVVVTAPVSITLACGATTVIMTPAGITMSAGGGALLKLDAALLAAAAGGAVQLAMGGDGKASLGSIAGGTMSVDSVVKLSAMSGSTVQIDGDVTASAIGGATLTLSTDAALQGNVATVAGGIGKLTLDVNANLTGTEACMCAGPSAIEATAAGVKIGGVTVDVAGQTMATMKALLVKVN